MSILRVSWNPYAKGSNVTLSNDNMTYHNSSYNGIARATEGKTSGKWYWEIRRTTPSATDTLSWGVCTDSFPLTGDVGGLLGYATAGAAGIYKLYHCVNPIGTLISIGGSLTLDTDVGGIALDLDSTPNTISYYINGILLATDDISSLSKPLFPACQGADGNISCTVNFGLY